MSNKEIAEKIKNCKGIYFFHTQKTGGTYAATNIRAICKKVGIDYKRSANISGCFESEANCIPDGYLKVTTVRDPLQMLVSYWEYLEFKSTVYGRDDQGLKDRFWMAGRRTPFSGFSEFMEYYTEYGDFAFMADNPGCCWCYTLELDHRKVIGHALAQRSGANEVVCPALSSTKIRQTIGSDLGQTLLVMGMLSRPPQAYSALRERIAQWVDSSGNILWKSSTSGKKNIQDSFSYFWYDERNSDCSPTSLKRGDVRILLARLFTPWSNPFGGSDFGLENPGLPSSWVTSNQHHGWNGWINPICSTDDYSRFVQYCHPCIQTALSPGLLENAWEYILSPFHRLFDFHQYDQGGCCFDVVLKQENLSGGFDILKSLFGVQFDSSKKLNVTKDKRSLDDLLTKEEIEKYQQYFDRERKLFGYDAPDDRGILFGSDLQNFFEVDASNKMSPIFIG